jgi:ribosomal-protein-alanine N-acetyltransferase
MDYSALRRLEQACFGKDAWSFLELIAVLSYSEVARLKAVEENSMVGFIAGDPRPAEGWAWIATLAVDPNYQRRGIGRELLQACEKKLNLPKIKLTVRTSNLPAIALYESEGYQMTDIWKGYYRDGEDGMVMEKYLA